MPSMFMLTARAAAAVAGFADNFDRANSATLGAAWTLYPTATPPTFSIAANTAQMSAVGSGSFYDLNQYAALHDLGPSCPNIIDLSIKNARTSTSGYSYIWIGVNATATAGVGVRYDSSAGAGLQIFAPGNNSGTYTQVNTPTTWTNAGQAAIRVTYNRATGDVSAYQNGTLVRTTQITAGLTGTLVGFGSSYANVDAWDDLVVA